MAGFRLQFLALLYKQRAQSSRAGALSMRAISLLLPLTVLAAVYCLQWYGNKHLDWLASQLAPVFGARLGRPQLLAAARRPPVCARRAS